MTMLPVLESLLLLAMFLGPSTSLSAYSGTRRGLLKAAFASIATPALVAPSPSAGAETIGKDPDCDDSTCLGVWDGLLADCPHDKLFGGGAGCTSSQDDTPGIFAEPWDYSEATDNFDWEVQMRLLVPAVQLASTKRGDKADMLVRNSRYLRMLFTDGRTNEKSIGEFYFTPADTTVQFRIASLGASSISPFSSSLKNSERCELIRKELRYLKVPVLRNRRRTLLFVESDLDSFGPGSASLGPPAEMTTGELEGRQDVDPKLKIDLLEGFPRVGK